MHSVQRKTNILKALAPDSRTSSLSSKLGQNRSSPEQFCLDRRVESLGNGELPAVKSITIFSQEKRGMATATPR
ncbi:TPA: hypothetical protein N0F65_008308 [Lagenidium giganteum]|uniref:Uncharacterized protein n=1 Tax=Lagenidium giganteum TaxID=4803 RepID=A0AAV2YMS0_9STRA|nr:TPA: hypothetical protein N0F65_008308 [Lagenidium giganteum]